MTIILKNNIIELRVSSYLIISNISTDQSIIYRFLIRFFELAITYNSRYPEYFPIKVDSPAS